MRSLPRWLGRSAARAILRTATSAWMQSGVPIPWRRQIHPGASIIALRISGRAVLTNSGPVNALVSGPLELRSWERSILDARARARFSRESSQYFRDRLPASPSSAWSASCSLACIFYDRSRQEFLQLSITASRWPPAPERVLRCDLLPTLSVCFYYRCSLREILLSPSLYFIFLCAREAPCAAALLEPVAVLPRTSLLFASSFRLFAGPIRLVQCD